MKGLDVAGRNQRVNVEFRGRVRGKFLELPIVIKLENVVSGRVLC